MVKLSNPELVTLINVLASADDDPKEEPTAEIGALRAKLMETMIQLTIAEVFALTGAGTENLRQIVIEALAHDMLTPAETIAEKVRTSRVARSKRQS